MQTLNDLIDARADEYSFLKSNVAEFSPAAANVMFNSLNIYEENYFSLFDNLVAVLIMSARVADDDDYTTFFMLKYADHYEANTGGMLEECEGELIDLFDETCQIFEINPQ